MYFSFDEKKEYFKRISYKKQLTMAILSSERAYREAIKFYEMFLGEKTNFRFLLDELWNYLSNKSSLNHEDWFQMGLKIQKNFKKKGDYYSQDVISKLIGLLNMTIGMVIWENDKPDYWAGGCFTQVGSVISSIYDNKYQLISDSLIFYCKEQEWLTKAALLIEETEDLPLNYDWFAERIPDYERKETSLEFAKKYQKFLDAEKQS
ncbi:MAG TPA: hypothetical protein PKY59_15210 [Pyrinomonadaceae bacterium]|nr:hypothetical protein [Pyrinomonadaceae bacterium]